jgi:hypothetical protein
MSKVYTTEELIEILALERQACLKGDRLKLEISASGNPVLDQFFSSEGLQKFSAYQDFKASIHEYQRQNQVSGIIWREITVRGEKIRYPEVDHQLIALETDLDILEAAKNSIVEFWQKKIMGMDLYLSIKHGKQYQQVTVADSDRIIQRSQWATLLCYENPRFLEIIIQLGWGQPAEASYKSGFPVSGSEYIHAVNPGNLPIG